MTVIARAGPLSSPAAPKPARPSYAYAHWYMLAAFAVVLLGFWPTFFQPLTSGTTLRNVHGVTSTLWYLALVVQPWLVTNGYVRWHRRVAVAVIALLPVLTVTALMNTRVMLTRGALPPIARPLITYLDHPVRRTPVWPQPVPGDQHQPLWPALHENHLRITRAGYRPW